MHTSIHIHYSRASVRALARWWPQATMLQIAHMLRFQPHYPVIAGGAAKAVTL